MALTKTAPGWKGLSACTLHVVIYTIAVCAFWRTASPLVAALVFMPHWVIDRWSLASWLKIIRGRTFEGALANKGEYREFDIAFTALVYTVVDNTFHLMSLGTVLALGYVPRL
jgi:hypothetical protein